MSSKSNKLFPKKDSLEELVEIDEDENELAEYN